jgi:hypothetical protein
VAGHGLAARAGALRRVERAVAGDLAQASAAWLARDQRRLRDWLLLAGAVLVAALAAAAAALRVVAGRQAPAPAGETVLGLARRGQALADRQLQLLEGLTRDEPDPQRRRDLLGVDNLAGRLRRAAETMLAVAGPGPVRARPHALPVDAVLRAAVAEAEPGGSGGPPTPPALAGRGHGDPAGRLVPLGDGDADAAGHSGTDRRVDLLTTGDVQVARPGPAAGGAARAAGDRLGLVVVGRLAGRNRFGVRLGRSPTGGVSAMARLPASVLRPAAAVPVRR